MGLSDRLEHGTKPVAPVVMAYGSHGLGKSTWAASAAEVGLNPVFQPTESASQIDATKFPVAQTFEEVMDNLGLLLNEEHPHRMYVLDTLDFLEQLVSEYVCRTRKGDKGQAYKTVQDWPYGRGYAIADGVWAQFLAKCLELRDKKRMLICFVAHAASKTIADPTLEQYEIFAPKLHVSGKGVGIGNTVQELADCVLYMSKKRYTRTTDSERTLVTSLGERTIYTEEGAGWMAKNRYSLPPEIPMGDETTSRFKFFWKEMMASKPFAKGKARAKKDAAQDKGDKE